MSINELILKTQNIENKVDTILAALLQTKQPRRLSAHRWEQLIYKAKSTPMNKTFFWVVVPEEQKSAIMAVYNHSRTETEKFKTQSTPEGVVFTKIEREVK